MPGDDSQREPAVPRSISVLVPVLNEEGGLEPTVTQLIRILRKIQWNAILEWNCPNPFRKTWILD